MNTPTSSNPQQFLKLRTRVALSFVILATLASGILLAFMFLNFRNLLRESLRQRLESIVTIAALQQDGDAFMNIHSAVDEEYERVRLQNLKILRSDPDLVFVYTMRYDEFGLYFVVDAGDPNDPGFSPYGSRYQSPGKVLSENYQSITATISETEFYTDEYGSFLSAYSPISTSSGNVVGIIAADLSAEKIVAGERELLLVSLAMFLGIVPLIGLIGWLLGRNIAVPIEVLTNASTRIAQGELEYRPQIRSFIPEIQTLSHSFFSMSDQLHALIGELENRVTARTAELASATENIQYRANQMKTIAEVAHTVSLVQDIDQLLNSIVILIAERFGHYHIGVFLIDAKGEYAELSASNSIGGKIMLARKHKLKVGEVGIVGFVAGASRPRIALDVGTDAVYFNNPDLPETRSEMALPLLVRDRIIGILDLQSKETSAFKESDFDVYQILADQVAIAIENSRLYNETRIALEESRQVYADFVHRGWENIRKKNSVIGFYYDQQGSQALLEFSDVKEPLVHEDAKPYEYRSGDFSNLAIPLRLRDVSIGILNMRVPGNKAWNKDDISTLQRIADRTVLALENARLIDETRRRAEREQAISQITTNIRSNTDPQQMVQTALEELKQALGVNEIVIRPFRQIPPQQQESQSSTNIDK